MKVPDNLKRLYVKEEKYINKGFEKVYWVKSLFQFTAYLGVILALLKLTVENIVTLSIIFFFTALVCCRMIGWLWDRMNMFSYEIEFGNERDGFVNEVREKIIRKNMEEKK